MSENGGSLWGELKQRKVVRVAVIYVAASWAVLQVADTVAPMLTLPEWAPRLVLMLLVLGFPIALILAWAFELTPDGVQRAEPLATSSGNTSRAPFIAGVVVGIVAISVVAFLVPEGDRLDGDEEDALDPSVAAVVPFTYSGPDDLDYLGDGVFQLLAARLTGDVGPRAVDATASAAAWEEASATDAATAPAATARRLGAGLIVTGSAVASPSGLDLNATLRDLTTGEEISARVSGSPDSLATVVDRLASSLLSLAVGEYPESLERLTSAEPDALREYLIGQQQFRSGDFNTAVGHYQRAVELDSTFALAAVMLADASNNMLTVGEVEPLELAWRHRDRLSERDRVYVRARLGPNHPDPETRRERVRVYEDALRLAPDRSSIWYFLGESHLHRLRDGMTYEEVRRYFERAIELDPRNSLAWNHLLLTDLARADGESALRVAEDAAAIQLSIMEEGDVGALRAVVARDSTAYAAAVGSITTVFSLPWAALSRIFAPAPWAMRAEDAHANRMIPTLVPGPESTGDFQFHYQRLHDVGRPQAAEALRQRWARGSAAGDRPRYAVLNAVYANGSESSAQPFVDRLEASVEGVEPIDMNTTQQRALAMIAHWALARGNLERARGAAGSLHAAAGSPSVAAARALWLRAQALAFEAIAAGREGDLAEELLQQVEGILDEGPSLSTTDEHDALLLAVAATWARFERPEQALLTLERGSAFQFSNPFRARFARDRARYAAAAGDTTRAIEQYEYYLVMHYDPEPSVMPEVEAVRAELEALRGN